MNKKLKILLGNYTGPPRDFEKLNAAAAVLHDRSQHFSSSALIFAYIDKEPYTALEGQHMMMSEGIKVTYF